MEITRYQHKLEAARKLREAIIAYKAKHPSSGPTTIGAIFKVTKQYVSLVLLEAKKNGN